MKAGWKRMMGPWIFFLFNSNFRRNKIINDNTQPSLSSDHLDSLEGISADMFDENEYSEYLTGDSVDMTEPDRKVVDALKGKSVCGPSTGQGRWFSRYSREGLG